MVKVLQPQVKHTDESLEEAIINHLNGKKLNDYGVWGLKKFMGREYMGINRTTFLIDEKGKIEKLIEKVDTENSTEQILS